MIVIEDYNWLSAHLDDPDVIVLRRKGKHVIQIWAY